MKNIFLILSIVAFSAHAMEQLPKPEENECPKPNVPRYDRARRCFTRAVPSLVECALKQIPRVLVPDLKKINGETLDDYEAAIKKTLSRVPIELHAGILSSYNLLLHAARHDYKAIFYEKHKPKNASKQYYKQEKTLKIHEANQSSKEDTLTCNDTILDYDFNPSGNTIALSLKNGAVQFFQKKDTSWEDIGATPADNKTTVFHVTRFFDDTTCVSYNREIRNKLTLHTLNNASLQSSKIALESPIWSVNPNKKNILFFMDLASNLFCCLKTESGVCIQKITPLSSYQEFTSIISDGHFLNYVLNDFSKNPIFHIIGLVGTQLRAIKKIEMHTISSIANKVYVKRFKKGVIYIAKAIDDNPSFDEKIFEHHAIDVNTGKSIATFHDKFYVKPMLDLPYQAVLALIALKNSDDPSQLTAWEASFVVKNLSGELKNQLMEEHNKRKRLFMDSLLEDYTSNNVEVLSLF